jgi:hypothetical protein
MRRRWPLRRKDGHVRQVPTSKFKTSLSWRISPMVCRAGASRVGGRLASCRISCIIMIKVARDSLYWMTVAGLFS